MDRRAQQSYQQFCERLKSRQKKNKQERKQNLRQRTYHKMVESSEESNDEHIIKKTLKEGNRWWQKINRYYFKPIDLDFLYNMQEFTTSSDMLEFAEGTSKLLPYYQEILYSSHPIIFSDLTIRVMFRREFRVDQVEKFILASFELYDPTEKCHRSEEPLPINQRLMTFHLPTAYPYKENNEKIINLEVKDIDIRMTGFIQVENFIEKCLNYESIWRNQMDQVDKQILCWEQELRATHKDNAFRWKQVEKGLNVQKTQFPSVQNLEGNINKIRRFLLRNQTFSYFRSGYADKTYEQLEKANEYMRDEQIIKEGKKFPRFQTDCKICFSTKNDPNNQVIYCDECNTSFHQSCYGVEHISDDDFFCDACKYTKEEEKVKVGIKIEKPSCQICTRPKFPLKKVDGHFYHVSCLVLFNFAEIKDFQIKLKPGFTYDTIMRDVVENQLTHGYCQFCLKNGSLGMQFCCSDPLCAKSFHPICGYLNGCFFDIRRSQSKFITEVYCQEHKKRENQVVSQVYMRRYFCNYKNTVDKTQEQFILKYQEEQKKKLKAERDGEETAIRRIMKKTRTVRHYCEKLESKISVQPEQKQTPQKKKAQIPNSSQPQQLNTEIREIIRTLPKKNIQ